ncbi:MAG: fumarate hydratase [Spirochaetes bacterium]|nr:fumarate hydratase [Spirochaetota bacterium]
MKKKIISSGRLSETVVELVRRASFTLPGGVGALLGEMAEREVSEAGRAALAVLGENSAIAEREHLPLCQDCGVAIVFLDIGEKIAIEGNPVDAVNRGVEEAYRTHFLRKSLVDDPFRRRNTGTNTPAMIHAEFVPGERLGITVYLKGGGSENRSALRMFRPTDTPDAVIDYIAETVIAAGPDPCPPLFLGVGIGGTADTAMVNAKRAVLRGVGTRHPDPFYADLEVRIKSRLNDTGVGPLGFGGSTTAAEVYILAAPTHIATLPVALNLNCHSLRYAAAEL